MVPTTLVILGRNCFYTHWLRILKYWQWHRLMPTSPAQLTWVDTNTSQLEWFGAYSTGSIYVYSRKLRQLDWCNRQGISFTGDNLYSTWWQLLFHKGQQQLMTIAFPQGERFPTLASKDLHKKYFLNPGSISILWQDSQLLLLMWTRVQ